MDVQVCKLHSTGIHVIKTVVAMRMFYSDCNYLRNIDFKQKTPIGICFAIKALI